MVDYRAYFNQLVSLLPTSHFFIPSLCPLCEVPTQGRILCQNCCDTVVQSAHCCALCAEPLAPTTTMDNTPSICGRCQIQKPAFDAVIVAGLFQPPLSELIKAFKFSDKLHIAPVLAKLLHNATISHLSKSQKPFPEALIPVPLHPKRLSQRGFNQTAQLCGYLSKYLNIPVLDRAVIRIKNTHEQSTINLKQRKANIIGAFKVNAKLPKHIAIVDDVITSGSTCQELSRCLKKAGVQRIDVLAVAKTPFIK